jgi:hypothetical protein
LSAALDVAIETHSFRQKNISLFLIDREHLVSIMNRTYMRHVSPWLFGDLGSHLKSYKANG